MAIALAACGADEGEASTSPTASPTPTPAPPSTGVVIGVVRLAPGAELPGYADHPMAPTPGRPPLPENCGPASEEDRHPVGLGEGRGLEGVLVALSDFATAPEHEPVTHEVEIRDCRLTPRLITATLGDRMRLTNHTDYPFLPDLGQGMMQAVLHGRSREVELGQGGAQSLGCGFAAQCGRAEVITLYHSLHTATGVGGSFRIEGVPPGESLRVSAWHPFFREASATVRVERGGTERVELVLEPIPAAPAPPPAEPREGPAENDPSTLF